MLQTVKPIVHAKYNKIDGMKHLKLFEDDGMLPKNSVEKFSICKIEDVAPLVLDRKRDYPLLVRTSFLEGIPTDHNTWTTQPRRKFAEPAHDFAVQVRLEDFFFSVKKFEEAHGTIAALVLHLPNARYLAQGSIEINYISDPTYKVRLCANDFTTNADAIFRNMGHAYFELGLVGKDPKIQKWSSAGRPATILAKIVENVRHATGIFSDKKLGSNSEINFVVYQGTAAPIYYDWLVEN